MAKLEFAGSKAPCEHAQGIFVATAGSISRDESTVGRQIETQPARVLPYSSLDMDLAQIRLDVGSVSMRTL